jgi:anti-anti-sigma regulatory factor
VSAENPTLIYREGEFSWIRCEGKGSFLNSPVLKKWVDGEIDHGVTHVIVDLGACSGMDSTFMGTLAGMAMRLMKLPDGVLQIAEPGEKNKKSLEGLGLDVLMQIDPGNTSWSDRIDEIREKLTPYDTAQAEAPGASYVLEAHKKLCEADDRNAEKFGTVLDFLEAEVKAKLKTEK